jgi:hypothetical protein
LRQPLNWLLVFRNIALALPLAGSGGVGAELPGGMALMAVIGGAGGFVGLSSFQRTGGAAIQPAFGHFASHSEVRE